MNCFQIFLSSWWFATYWRISIRGIPLWIAFKFFYLRDGSQRPRNTKTARISCELLSNFSIFVMVRNQLLDDGAQMQVVNCFQIFLSSWWFATHQQQAQQNPKLWIAFKFFYLRDGSQLINLWDMLLISCELLSNFSIFVMVRNCTITIFVSILVVNCFQIFLSSWWFATS